MANEFQTRLPAEIDFEKEASNCERCAKIFKDNKNVAVPKVYREYTKERVLTMSFEPGIPVTSVNALYKEGIDLK